MHLSKSSWYNDINQSNDEFLVSWHVYIFRVPKCTTSFFFYCFVTKNLSFSQILTHKTSFCNLLLYIAYLFLKRYSNKEIQYINLYTFIFFKEMKNIIRTAILQSASMCNDKKKLENFWRLDDKGESYSKWLLDTT